MTDYKLSQTYPERLFTLEGLYRPEHSNNAEKPDLYFEGPLTASEVLQIIGAALRDENELQPYTLTINTYGG